MHTQDTLSISSGTLKEIHIFTGMEITLHLEQIQNKGTNEMNKNFSRSN